MKTMVTVSGVLLVLFMSLSRSAEGLVLVPVAESRDNASTLAFVIDLTGSMSDDLEQVQDGTSRILAKTLSRTPRPVQNFVLVGFNDPAVGPVTITSDPITFQRNLDRLTVGGGGDCPEMALGGIKKALEVSLPRSFIFMFADASAKDYHLLPDVLRLVEEKQSQVVFVMTGDCGDRTAPGYTAYETIADASSGQVFNLAHKSEVNQVLRWVENTLQAQRVHLMSCNHDGAQVNTWDLLIDRSLAEFTVSLSGPTPQIQLTDPLGRVIGVGGGLIIELNTGSVLVVTVRPPRDGTWRLRVSSSGRHTLRVTGITRSDLNFRAGFSSRRTNTTSAMPVGGGIQYVLLRVTGLPPPGNLSSCELVSTSGRVLHSLTPSGGYGGLWSLPPFRCPTQSFFIKVTGFNQWGQRFQRISSVSYTNPDKTRRGPDTIPSTTTSPPTTESTTTDTKLEIAHLFCEPWEIQVGLGVSTLLAWGLNPSSGHMDGRGCSNSTEYDGKVWYRVERQEGACGNVLTTNLTHAIYSNTLYIFPINTLIKVPMSFPFSCAYPLDTQSSINAFYGRVQVLSGLGPPPTATMRLFHFSNYTDPYPVGAAILPHGSALHVGVFVQWTDTHRFVVVLDNCYVTPSYSHNDSMPDYQIRHKCPFDRKVRVDENGVSLQALFSAQIEVSYLQVYLHCGLFLCDQTVSHCTPICSRRHPRTVSSSMDIQPLTIGPITWE